MTERLLIYGATGFTGRLMVQEALRRGLRPLLGGRSGSSLGELARTTGLESRIGGLGTSEDVASLLDGVDVVLNAAGPFAETAMPLARGCLARGAHYLDISGEIDTLRQLPAFDGEARQRRVMLMPAVGFDVVPSDCLAAWLVQHLPGARELAIGIAGLDAVSRGSVRSVLEMSDGTVTVRRGGRLQSVRAGELQRDFDFGNGPCRATAVPWGDVVTAYYSTGVGDISVYYGLNPVVTVGITWLRHAGSLLRAPGVRSWLGGWTQLFPHGPDDAYRARQRAVLVAIARDVDGRELAARIETPEVYTFTAHSSIAIAERALRGELQPGFQTPARVFGADFAFSLPGVSAPVLT